MAQLVVDSVYSLTLPGSSPVLILLNLEPARVRLRQLPVFHPCHTPSGGVQSSVPEQVRAVREVDTDEAGLGRGMRGDCS